MAYNKTQWNPGGAPGISAENLNNIESGIESAHKLVETDIHTPDQSQTAQASGTLLALQSFFANILQRILGNTNWHDAPPITLSATKAHTEAGAAHGATSQAVAAKIIVRDAYGRAKVAAPSAADDIARLDSITKTQAGLGNVDNVKQATKTEFDAKMHATTGHKHTGATGDGPLISHLGPPTGSGTWTTDSNGNVTIQHNLGRIPIVVWTRPNYMYRLSNVTTTSFSIQYYSSSSGSGNYWYW